MFVIHRLGRVVAVAALVLATAFAARSAPALAYGNGGSAHQIYQITVSASCNNPSLCGADQLGGFWGWAVLYDDGTGEAEITGCGHTADAHGPGLQGAGHVHIDFTWDVENGFFVATSETDVAVGHGQPTTITIPSEHEPLAPAAPGHYSAAQQIFGFTGPGVSFQIQVVALH